MISPQAIISPRAKLAQDVEVGPFSVIGAEVEIGPRCWIGPHVVINGQTSMGADNKIYQFASIGAAPQDKKYSGGPTRLVIGERNVFRESCTINRGATPEHGLTRIGNDNLFMACTHVAHDCTLGNNIVMVNYAGLAGHVELGDWVILSGYTGVHQFCKIGEHAFTAALSGVTRDVPPYIMAVGQPAMPHSINSEGLKRRGFTPEQILNIRHAYRLLYRSGLKLKAAMQELEKASATQPEIRPFVDFIARSERSIVR